jgi:hypothetical protein
MMTALRTLAIAVAVLVSTPVAAQTQKRPGEPVTQTVQALGYYNCIRADMQNRGRRNAA